MLKVKTGFIFGTVFMTAQLTASCAFAWGPYDADLYGRYTLSVSSSGTMAPGEDAVTVARIGDHVVHAKLSPFGDNSVKAELFVYSGQGEPGSPLKLVAKPVLLGLAGQPMECALSAGDGKPWFTFRFTPLLKTGDYAGPQLEDETLSKTDAVFAGNLDTEAMYWAWRISVKKDAPYYEVVKYSRSWDISAATREKFWFKTGELIASGKARKLNSWEKRRMKEAEKKLKELTADEPRYDRALKRRLAAVDAVWQGILATDAMYWAWRITHDKDVTYDGLREDSKNWVASRAHKDRLFGAIKEILDSGKARPLTPDEEGEYENAQERAKNAGK
jgi:hypothetical protein